MPDTTRTLDRRISATASATTSPRTKLMRVSGIVAVTVARSSGPSESRMSWTVWSFTRGWTSGSESGSARSRSSRCAGSGGGRGRLDRHVGAEVLLRQLLQRPVGPEVGEGLVDGGDEVGALAGGDDLLGDVAGLRGDLDALVTRRLLVVEHGEAVVDRGVDALLLEQGDGLGEALDRLDLGPGVLGDLRPVARQALRGLLAGEPGQRGDRRVVGARRDDALGPRVRRGQAVEAGALGVLRHLVDDDVEALGGEAGEDRVPRGLDVLDLDAELVGDRLGDLDVVAGEGVGLRVVEGEGRVRALGPDAQDLGVLDGLQVRAAARGRAARGEHRGQERDEQDGEG